MSKLIECPMCEKMISPNASFCVNCGEPNQVEKVAKSEKTEEPVSKEQNENLLYDVLLINPGEGKTMIEVAKCICDCMQNDFKEVTKTEISDKNKRSIQKDYIEAIKIVNSVKYAPSMVVQSIAYEDACSVRDQLVRIGATVELVNSPLSESIEIENSVNEEDVLLYNIKMTRVGNSPILLENTIRAITELKATEVEEIIKNTPITIKKDISIKEASEIKMRLERGGADAVIIEAGNEELITKPVPIKFSPQIHSTDNRAKCPRCASADLTAQKKGFGFGKAVAGTVLTGGLVGVLAGGIGSNKTIIVCLKCGHKFRPGGY